MNKKIALVGGLGLGAALMYLFDPDRGERRRALIREKAEGAANKVSDYAEQMSRDLRDRAYEVVAETKAIFKGGDNPLDAHAAENDAPSSPGTTAPFGSGPATAGNPYPTLGEPHVL